VTLRPASPAGAGAFDGIGEGAVTATRSLQFAPGDRRSIDSFHPRSVLEASVDKTAKTPKKPKQAKAKPAAK
jgi:hypothetical protein